MGTVFEEAIDVRMRSENPQQNPSTFRWRSHLYVVVSVLSHWRERNNWWASAAAKMLHEGRGAVDTSGTVGAKGSGDAIGTQDPRTTTDPGESHPTHPALLGEREVWRVEARRVTRSELGVYDLRRDRGLDETEIADRWFLSRVVD